VVDPRDILLDKPRYGAFHGTDLDLILRARGIDTVIIAGIATNVCCETTAREAVVRDFRVFFLSDGTATFGKGDASAAEHTGKELEPVAASIEAGGQRAFTPTIRGNRPGDPKTVGLAEAIQSIVDYVIDRDLSDVVLAGHSYGGMVITGVADRAPERVRCLVYWNAFVPNNGESVNDMLPPQYVALFDAIAAERGDGSIVLPFPIWQETFINEADVETARRAYNA
jgi:isochorismatase family protein/alpha/beta hydrolase family protein